MEQTTSNGSPPKVRVTPPQAIEQVDVHALHTLLTQIAGQFNEIIDGKYPKPAAADQGPILQVIDESGCSNLD